MTRTTTILSLELAAREAGADGMPYSEVLQIVRRQWADGAILGHDGNRSATARDLGIHRNTLKRMVKP